MVGTGVSRRVRVRGWSSLGLTARLMVLHVLTLVVAMSAVLGVVAVAFSNTSMNAIDGAMADDVREFLSGAAARPTGQSLAAFTSGYLAQFAGGIEGSHLVVALAGAPLAASPNSTAILQDASLGTLLAAQPAGQAPQELQIGSRTYRLLVSPIVLGGASIGTIAALHNLARTQGEVQTVVLLTGGEALVAVLLAVISTSLVLRRVVGIVAEVTNTAESITTLGPDRRLEERRQDDEIGRLVHTFNGMLDRLDRASQAQRRLLSDVSHQMRTPLTVMRGHLEVARRTGVSDEAETLATIDLVLDELDHTSALVDRLLTLGRSLEPDFIDAGPVELRAFLADLHTAVQPLAPRRWVLDSVPDVVVLVDREKLRGALLNLVDNAIKATGPADTIAFGAASGPGGSVVISVADTGKGIPAELQERIFGRFERGTRADERGAGLGLAIVKAVAEAHGGGVALQSAADAGCTIRITLPASRVIAMGGPTAASDGLAAR